jgi:hypothetical protein
MNSNMPYCSVAYASFLILFERSKIKRPKRSESPPQR